MAGIQFRAKRILRRVGHLILALLQPNVVVNRQASLFAMKVNMIAWLRQNRRFLQDIESQVAVAQETGSLVPEGALAELVRAALSFARDEEDRRFFLTRAGREFVGWEHAPVVSSPSLSSTSLPDDSTSSSDSTPPNWLRPGEESGEEESGEEESV